MKLIRLTDDRYVLDAGLDVKPVQLEEIHKYWNNWWATHPTGEAPGIFVVGGMIERLTYEDRREPDIESRLRALEEHVHVTNLIDRSGPPVKP